MVDCSNCGSSMIRMYSKEYLNKHYPVKSYEDRVNMNFHVESKRLFKCSKCENIKRLSFFEYFVYIMKYTIKRVFSK
ncbi:hypothetical protein ES702_00697 [subsurface metagenome]